ncbi:MAG: PilZ domain-containing protein [Acidimicrobiales bacterium]|nr:PilZ domain-containing protein [Acidimicrobiales bacterium]
MSVTKGPGSPCPPSETIDIGRHGMLVRLATAAQPVCVGEKVLVSLELEDGALHLLGRTTRCLRGVDDHWYLAVEFDEVEPMDRSRLDRLIEPAGPLPVPLGEPR